MSVPSSRRWGNSKSPGGQTHKVSLRSPQHAVNVKSYLGIQQALSCNLDTCPEGETLSFSTSPLSISPLSMSCTPHSSAIGGSSGSSGSRRPNPGPYFFNTSTQPKAAPPRQQRYTNQVKNTTRQKSSKPTILLEDMPKVPQTQMMQQQQQQPRPAMRKHSSSAASIQSHNTISSAARFRQEAFAQDFSNDIAIDADLDDVNSYMMSVYMNEDSSVYSKGTASTASTSSSSLASKRSRHKGASHRRIEDVKQAEEERPQKETGFLKSMKESSNSFFVEGNWSQKYGWYLAKKWDATPGEGWEQPDPIFDKEETFEDI